MGVSTQGAIKQNVSLLELKEAVEKKTGCIVEVRGNLESGFLDIANYKEDGFRNLHYYYGKDYDNLFGDELAIHLSLGKWGDAVPLMTDVLSVFGGYLDENDCDDIDIEETYIQKEGDFEPSPRWQDLHKIAHMFDARTSKSPMAVAINILQNKDKVLEILTNLKSNAN